MNDRFNRPGNPSYTLSDALVALRGTLGMSQQQLADFTLELAEQGIIGQALAQQHISRIEGGASPQETTLVVLATALAEAYNREGWDTSPAEILKHLRNAKSIRVDARDVSPEAAQLDAILSVIKGDAYDLIWATLIAGAIAYLQTFKGQLAERKKQREQQEANTTDYAGEQ